MHTSHVCGIQFQYHISALGVSHVMRSINVRYLLTYRSLLVRYVTTCVGERKSRQLSASGPQQCHYSIWALFIVSA